MERWRADTEDTQDSDMTPGGKPHRGIIVAGWGESKPPPSSPSPAPCQHLGKWSGEYCMTQTELDTFNMSFTKQTLSGRGRRRPVLVSRARSDPWRPAGVSHRSTAQHQVSCNGVCTDSLSVLMKSQVTREPFCSVCLNDDVSEAELEVRREMEREVKLLQSRPSQAYRKHSPNNWTQDHMIGDYTRLLFFSHFYIIELYFC